MKRGHKTNPQSKPRVLIVCYCMFKCEVTSYYINLPFMTVGANCVRPRTVTVSPYIYNLNRDVGICKTQGFILFEFTFQADCVTMNLRR